MQIPSIPRGAATLLILALAICMPAAFGADPTSGDVTPAEPAPDFDWYPLRPADTSSPRDTLRSFDAAMTEAYEGVRLGRAWETIKRAANRGLETFDFSQLPDRGRRAAQVEAALQLKAILDRVQLPIDDEIPGNADVADDPDKLVRWVIPDTKITIERIEEGPRAGEYLFTAETVERLDEYYERAKHLPYKAGTIAGFYEEYIRSPGRLVPSGWVAALPAWSETLVFGEALWQWVAFAIVMVIAFLLIRWFLLWGKRWDDTHRGSALMRLGLPLGIVAGIALLYACRIFFYSGIRLLGTVGLISSVLLWTLIFSGVAWLVMVVAGRLAEAINEHRQVKEGSIDGQLVRVFLRLVSVVILLLLIVFAADFFGVPVTPVLAGLGVGGLAIALAVRPTLENIIGGLTLFADKPVRIGNFCRFGTEYGTVEEIGLRSTRLRKLDDTVVTVPNSDFSQRELTNYALRRRWLYETTLALRYETSAEQLRYVIAKLREMLLAHPKVSPDALHVRFEGFGDYALNIKLFAYIRTREWLNFRAIREDINLRIMEIVAEAGTGFAFPSQTAYLGRDSGLDAERTREAEQSVQTWRTKGELPFPEFPEDQRETTEDTLDYPPIGSPEGVKP